MSTKTGNDTREMSYDSIIEFVRDHEEPVVTAGDVAQEFDVTNGAANYRLKRLKERGEVAEKEVGASAKVWYLVG